MSPERRGNDLTLSLTHLSLTLSLTNNGKLGVYQITGSEQLLVIPPPHNIRNYLVLKYDEFYQYNGFSFPKLRSVKYVENIFNNDP